MKRFLIVSMVMAISIGIGLAANDFDNDLSSFRKTVFTLCAELQKSDVGINKGMLNQMDEILLAWDAISSRYKNNPPQQYSSDPSWAMYFDEAKDNFLLMRENIAKGNVKRAVQFCGSNCLLFVKIHKINGMVTLADRMFDLRSGVKMMLSMANAGNWKGVDIQINQCDSIINELHVYVQNNKSDAAQQDVVKKIDLLWNEFKQKVQSHDIQSIKEGSVKFLKDYNQMYYEVL